MKIEVLKTELVQAVKALSKLTARAKLPILQCIEFRTSTYSSALTLTATDLDITLSITIPARVTFSGNCVIPSSFLLLYLKELNNSTVEIESTYPDGVRILSGLIYRSTETLDPNSFPKQLPNAESYVYAVREKVLKEMLTLSKHAKCSDKTRHAICGTLMSAKNHTLKLVTTNGMQLAIIEKELDTSNTEQNNVTIPNNTIETLEKLLQDTWNLVRVSVDTTGKQVGFSWSGIYLSTKLVEGNYPDYNQVIPIQTVAKFKLNKEELLRIIKRMFNATRITLTITQDTLTVSTLDRCETMMVYYPNNTTVTASVNPAFITELLKELEEVHVTMELTDEQSAVVMRTDSITSVFMPVRTN